MTDVDAFWALIATLGRDPDDDDFGRLIDRLAAHPPQEIIAFADRLAVALHALDTPGHFAAVRSAGDDWFLYVRCAAVAAGQKAYAKVLEEPAGLGRFADREAELLLAVAPEAYERATGMLWEHETPVSYGDGGGGSSAAEQQTSTSWLTFHHGWGVPGGWPFAYDISMSDVALVLGDDLAWSRWWQATGVPGCEVALFIDEPGSTADLRVKKGRKRISASRSQSRSRRSPPMIPRTSYGAPSPT